MTRYDYDLFTIGAGSGGVRASRVASSLRPGAIAETPTPRHLRERGLRSQEASSTPPHYRED
jgi:hypothetical protein